MTAAAVPMEKATRGAPNDRDFEDGSGFCPAVPCVIRHDDQFWKFGTPTTHLHYRWHIMQLYAQHGMYVCMYVCMFVCQSTLLSVSKLGTRLQHPDFKAIGFLSNIYSHLYQYQNFGL